MDVIDAKANAKKWQIELGAERATAKVKAGHMERLATLDEEERDEVDRLSGDPAALAELLTRLSS